MQISRHWRMNSNRYRLEGVQNEDGTVSIQNRRQQENIEQTQDSNERRSEQEALNAA